MGHLAILLAIFLDSQNKAIYESPLPSFSPYKFSSTKENNDHLAYIQTKALLQFVSAKNAVKINFSKAKTNDQVFLTLAIYNLETIR
jgi:hypothetical protein